MSALVGVLLVTHGDVARAMLAAARVLLGEGPTHAMESLCIDPKEPRESIQARIREATERLDRGDGVLIACDLHGSTPANCAIELKRSGKKVEVLCGLSLPMLIKIASIDRAQHTPAELAHVAAETAIRSVRLGDGGAA
ncbi:MAG: PTS sugar transporter subunit IIA [Deltaproteobacteria bacterium]|nr:PTS sugar transporter subunit IIA [Deltaproteobacteria bacterium]